MTFIQNARIESTMLGWKGAAGLTYELVLDYGGPMQSFGGWTLDNPPREKGGRGSRQPSVVAGAVIARILKVVGVERWEDIAGKYIRVELTEAGYEGLIIRIGNVLKDEWFRHSEVLDDYSPVGLTTTAALPDYEHR